MFLLIYFCDDIITGNVWIFIYSDDSYSWIQIVWLSNNQQKTKSFTVSFKGNNISYHIVTVCLINARFLMMKKTSQCFISTRDSIKLFVLIVVTYRLLVVITHTLRAIKTKLLCKN